MWQVAGGHGHIDCQQAIADMARYHNTGFTTWDLADIYGPAEDFIGKFRQILSQQKGNKEIDKIQALTKWVPDPQRMTLSTVQSAIEKSLRRMGGESIDLIQFHWWDYNNPYYIDALRYLSKLHESGKIKNVGLTNFDTEHMQLIKDADLNLAIVSNQVQYSIIDRRPEVKMTNFCQDNNIKLLTYGTICGGLISERYIERQEPPQSHLDTLSLRKYKRMIDAWGGWRLFQELLFTLKEIAQKHGKDISIANVATRYILDKPIVAGVIIGVRLGITDHRENNLRAFNLNLDNEDIKSIEEVCSESNDLFERIGDCGEEYRQQ
jgi:aryl-alcohol dehydrogenase-like predicted oxidoreductase